VVIDLTSLRWWLTIVQGAPRLNLKSVSVWKADACVFLPVAQSDAVYFAMRKSLLSAAWSELLLAFVGREVFIRRAMSWSARIANSFVAVNQMVLILCIEFLAVCVRGRTVSTSPVVSRYLSTLFYNFSKSVKRGCAFYSNKSPQAKPISVWELACMPRLYTTWCCFQLTCGFCVAGDTELVTSTDDLSLFRWRPGLPEGNYVSVTTGRAARNFGRGCKEQPSLSIEIFNAPCFWSIIHETCICLASFSWTLCSDLNLQMTSLFLLNWQVSKVCF